MQVEISMSDVEKHGAYPQLKAHKAGVKAVLYLMGLDLSKKYSSEVLSHRSRLTKDTVDCMRWVGTQRTDPAFQKLLLKAESISHRVTCYD